MQEFISAKGIRIGTSLKHFIEAKLRNSFDRFKEKVRLVSLRLTDENWRRGGIDKRCKVQLQLRNGDHIVREYCDAEPALAVSEAVSRAERALAVQIERRRARRVSYLKVYGH